MVYCGKPSKGCSHCRERKIRCDQREPGCGQCEKRGQTCPGYRNIVDLMFRDESSHVIKKARAKARKKGGLSVESGSSPEEVSSASPGSATAGPRGKILTLDTKVRAAGPSQGTRDDEDSLLPSPDSEKWPAMPLGHYALAPKWQERGMAYFFSRYVTIDENSCHQRFDFVYDIWKPVSLLPDRQRDGVLASMTAVGLMGLANMTHSQETHGAARESYGRAIRLLHSALENPTESVKDTTMLTVLILGLFEMMTESTHRTLKAWQQHIKGAAELAKVRGMSQFRSGAGIRMFLMLCQNVMISCIQKELPMPETLVSLRNELSKLFKTNEPSVEISRPIYKVLQFRYDIMKGNIDDPDLMVEKLDDVEAEFERVISTFPESWQYRVFRVSQPHPAVFRNVCHVYPKMWIATIWNGLRSCRILVLETIVEQLSKELAKIDRDPSVKRFENAYRDARAKLERLSLAIVASVPQHFGLLNPLNSYSNTLSPMTPAEEQEYNSSPPGSWSEDSSDDDTFYQEGLTLIDPTRARGPEETAERYMLLASATNTIVWPLYLLGMSSVCTPALRQYVIDRLNAVYSETGVAQARQVAEIIINHKTASDTVKLPVRTQREGAAGSRTGESHGDDAQRIDVRV